MTKSQRITYINGDIFDYLPHVKEDVIVPHICNDIGVMGAGFVTPLNKHYVGVKRLYQEWYKGNKTNRVAEEDIYGKRYLVEYSYYAFGNDIFGLGNVQFLMNDNVVIANMIGQEGVGSQNIDGLTISPIRYIQLGIAMQNVAKHAHHNSIRKIYAPKFGSGLAGGNWVVIEKMIYEAWTFNGLDVTIFEL